MTRKEFWKLYEERNLEKILPVLSKAKAFGFIMKEYTLQSSDLRDYEQLYFLWQLKAKAYTEKIKVIFERFEKGETYKEIMLEEAKEKQKKLESVKADLTKFKSVKKIPFGEIVFEKNEDKTYKLTLPILPYLIHDYVCENGVLEFDPLEITEKHIKKGRIDFEDDTFGQSIYLFGSHNPVDLNFIQFKDISENSINIEINLAFLFEYEGNGKDQKLVIPLTIPNIFIN
ncbi:hypothetical protein EMA8858_02066 [Emticicia aquatica]|jgi:hypothetical protein|uniref:Uncharacterized protein n=1 Tax=Emticicia aquatica TaxID=1681835 RepID=A0ABM9AQ22_9BACT|nr:hypothetical protein [Emticicia aquatica]CAH0995938.1 hypothetical protein EMA8858_02066 [Emticicia aquatica]